MQWRVVVGRRWRVNCTLFKGRMRYPRFTDTRRVLLWLCGQDPRFVMVVLLCR